MALKHVGRIKNNKRKVVVAYRVVPNEPENCIVVTTENLMAEEHDALMKTVESHAGQTAYEFAEAMARTTLPDGRNMLSGFHSTGKLIKVSTKEVEMTPDRVTTIGLDELNHTIASQKGVSVEDLAIKGNSPQSKKADDTTTAVVSESVSVAEQAVDQPLSDEQLAAQYRSQADAMYKEAKRLREMAEDLVPTKKKTSKTAESV